MTMAPLVRWVFLIFFAPRFFLRVEDPNFFVLFPVDHSTCCSWMRTGSCCPIRVTWAAQGSSFCTTIRQGLFIKGHCKPDLWRSALARPPNNHGGKKVGPWERSSPSSHKSGEFRECHSCRRKVLMGRATRTLLTSLKYNSYVPWNICSK